MFGLATYRKKAAHPGNCLPADSGAGLFVGWWTALAHFARPFVVIMGSSRRLWSTIIELLAWPAIVCKPRQ